MTTPRNIPEDFSPTEINEMVEGPEGQALFDALNPSFRSTVALLGKIAPLTKPEIDLRGRNLDVRYEYVGRPDGWRCWDANTYDGTPDHNIFGYGDEKEDALVGLMEKIGPLAAAPKLGKVIHSSRYEPTERAQYRDPDDFDGDDSRE